MKTTFYLTKKITRYFKKRRFLIIRISVIIIYVIGTSPIVFCDDGGLSGKELMTALTVAGTVTASIVILGIRYLIMGDSASGLLGDSVSGIIENGKDAANELINNAEASGTRLIDHTANTVNEKVSVITGAVDERIATVTNAINPVTHVQAVGDKAVNFVKKVLNKANDALNSNDGFANVEEEVKTRLHTGLQKALADLNQTGDVNAALQNMSQEEMTMLAEYTVISREPSTVGSVEMPSIMEPLCLQYSNLILFALIVMLKLAPFYLYYYICIKQKIRSYFIGR